jgi:hypothetical protein
MDVSTELAELIGSASKDAPTLTITQRLCTHYLPPIWGYFSLRWLEKRGFV